MNIFNFHKRNFDLLKSAYLDNKLHHSYIFYGANGIGKFRFAIDFARFLNCEKRAEDEPCGKCKNCLLAKNDFIPGGYVLDKGQEETIHIDDIEKAKKQVELSSFAGKKKVIVINNFQNITHQARDVLLKTLEEPPGDALMVLITDNKKNLSQTILSRCPALYFNKGSLKNWQDFLGKDIIGEKELLDTAYFFYLNNIFNLKEEGADFISDLKKEIGLLENILTNNERYKKLVMMNGFEKKDGYEEKIKKWIVILYGIVLIKNDVFPPSEGEIKKSLLILEKKLEYDKIIVAVKELYDILYLMHTNSSKRLLLENFVLNI